MEKITNSFTSYNFTEEELILASSLSEYQVAYLQTLAAQEAEALIALTYDANNPILFAQKQAECLGAIRILNTLINTAKRV